MKICLSLVLLISTLSPALAQEVPNHEISSRVWHLGDDPTPEWTEAPAEPEGTSLSFSFDAKALNHGQLLAITHHNINNDWTVHINGERAFMLRKIEDRGVQLYEVPKGLLRDGANQLMLSGSHPADDITFGPVTLHEGDLRQVLNLRRVEVRVTSDSMGPLPARVTVLDSEGNLAETYYGARLQTAVRLGVLYTSDGSLEFEVPAGEYTILATRGVEWSMAKATVAVTGSQQSVELRLTHELKDATTGFVAADTHIHTLTHSGHGDSSVEERMVTLAGEGVELAIATDHNHNTDYGPTQAAMGLQGEFKSVVGNEVSTPIGHLNAFPLNPDDAVPAHDLNDIVKIVEGIRAKGAKAVILNHPRWPDHETGPHGVIGLDPITGVWSGDWACPFDAIELINSQTEEREPMLLFQDWFLLLNRGERVFAVGSSDSHTVGGVVGQGRTYVKSSTDFAPDIDEIETAENIANGHSSISMGIVAELRIDSLPVMGETASPSEVSLHIAAPSWVTPTKATLYANGLAVWSQAIPVNTSGGPTLANFTVDLTPRGDLALPDHDYHLIAVIEGLGVGSKAWPQINDYTLAATNPLFVDANYSEGYEAPLEWAKTLVKERGTDDATVASVLQEIDSSVAIQYLQLVREAYLADAERRVNALGINARVKHPNLLEWLRSLLGGK
jgi:hypothetical protein